MCVPAYRRGRDNYIMMDTLDFGNDSGYNLVDLIEKSLPGR